MYAIFAAMFMTQLKAIQITVSLQAPLLLISQMTGAAHSAVLVKATSLQKRKQPFRLGRNTVEKNRGPSEGLGLCFFMYRRIRQHSRKVTGAGVFYRRNG